MSQLSRKRPERNDRHRAGSGISIRVITGLSAAESTWREFEKTADRTVFQAYDWLLEWNNHVGKKREILPVIVIGLGPDGEPLILMPLAIEKRWLLRRLVWLGSDLCDYNAPLLARRFSACVPPERFGWFWREIIRTIRADPALRFEVVDLHRMPERVGAQQNPFLTLPVVSTTFGAHVATLATNWNEFYSSKRSAQDRKTDRRKMRNLAEYGELRFVDVRQRIDVEQTMETLIRQKQESYARMRVEDIFRRSGHREFFMAVTANPRLGDIVHVSRLDAGTEQVATGLGLNFQNRYHLLLSGYEDGEIARCSPGRMHLHGLMQYAIERNCREFDFTIGDEPYKLEWSDIHLKLFDYFEGATVGGRLIVANKIATRRANLFICQRPALRRPLSKLRSLMMVLGVRA